MGLFVEVVTDITLPIVLLIGFGVVLQRRVGLDVTTLNRLVVYGTVPCLLLVSLATAEIPAFEFEATGLFTLGQFAALFTLGWAVAALLRLERSLRPIIALSAAFANTGNFGIPLAELAFGPGYVPHQAVITSVLTVIIILLGPTLLSAGERVGFKRSLLMTLRTPLIPAVVLGLLLNAFDVPLPNVVRFPLELVGDANTPAALIALGAQLGAGTWAVSRGTVGVGVGVRLILGPLVTWVALLALGLPKGLSDLLLVAAGAPVGVLLPIFCAEYGGHPRLASAIVVTSTALSPLAVTLLVYLTRIG